MKPSTYIPLSHERKSSPGTAIGDVQTFTIPKNTSAVLLTAETTSVRVTLDGSDPSAASAPSIVIPKDSAPVLLPVGSGVAIKHVSTAAAAGVLQAVYLQ